MKHYKKYWVIFLLTLFVTGSMAGVAMANCGQATSEGGVTAMEMPCCDEGSHDHSSAGHKGSNSTHDGSNSVICDNCDGSICTVQALAPIQNSIDIYVTSRTNLIPENINLISIVLDRIPDPPKQIS